MTKKTKYIFALIAFVISLFPALSYAEKVLFFTPTRVLLNDNKNVEVMNITNLSDITRTYNISFQDQVMTYQGFTTPVDNFEHSAKRLLRFVPRDFTLAPGERQTIRIMSRLRPETQNGEYHTHIRFLEDVSKRHENNPPKPNQNATISAPLAYEALIPIILSHGDVSTSVGVKDVKISKNPDNGNYKIDLVLTREGNGQGIAYVDTHYIGPDGESKTVTPRRTVYLYREINERIKDYEFAVPQDLPKGGSLKVIVYDKNTPDATHVKELTLALPQ